MCSTKRIILRHIEGPLSGLNQIMGVAAVDFGCPAELTDFELTPGRLGAASFVRAADHYVLYQEITL